VGDVVRVRMYVARQEDTEEVGVAFSGLFNNEVDGVDDEVGTAATMIVVGKGGFVDPEMLVEVELDAVVF
jgi:enamine deaminase RidA (YjgF/YER057c/UK114 family)